MGIGVKNMWDWYLYKHNYKVNCMVLRGKQDKACFWGGLKHFIFTIVVFFVVEILAPASWFKWQRRREKLNIIANIDPGI